MSLKIENGDVVIILYFSSNLKLHETFEKEFQIQQRKTGTYFDESI